MTRYFDYVNLTLLALLGGLCVVQWTHEKDYSRQLVELRQTTASQGDKLAVQEESLLRAGEDIAGFKTEIVTFKEQADTNNALIRQQKSKIFVLEEDSAKLTRQLADWQRAVEDYKKGVAVRDESIKTLLDQREQLVAGNKEAAGKANEAIGAYNELATKYEDVVTRYNTLAARYQAEHQADSDKK